MNTTDTSDSPNRPEPTPPAAPLADWRARLAAKYPWLPYALPMVVYLLSGTLDSTANAEVGGGRQNYPWIYTARVAATLICIWISWPTIRQFAFRVSPLAILFGVVGVVLWIGLCRVQQETPLLDTLGLGSLLPSDSRAAFNPLEAFAEQPIALAAFLAVRFLGLVVVVAIIEELFLRGLAVRMVQDPHWEKVPIGQGGWLAFVVTGVYGVLSHPGEALAAAAWFPLITLLVVRTRNLWDAIVAHGTTNLLLGIYVLATGAWQLW